MLTSHEFVQDGVRGHFCTLVRQSIDLPGLMHFWMAHVARDVLRLGVFFHAATLLREVPGATDYQWYLCDDGDPDVPDGEDDPDHWLDGASRTATLDVLAECLWRLEAPDLLARVPGGAGHRPYELSAERQAWLDRMSEFEHGLLNVVAECLDRLIVAPGLAQIDAQSVPAPWKQWWGRMEE